jgi:neurofibromin 1
MGGADERRLMGHAVGPAGISVSEAFTTLFEQAIPILRSIVERMHPGENAMQIDMGELLHTMASYLQRTGRDDASLRLKARFCQLVEVVLQKPNCVILSNDGRFRNSTLDWMTEWSTETVRVSRSYFRSG